MSGRSRTDFTENLQAVALGVRRLDEVRDPILREAIAAALRVRDRELRLDTASRTRMRNTVLAALAPAKPTLADRTYSVFALLGKPAPMLVRSLAIIVLIAVVAGGATAASSDALPEDLLYGFKLAGEQVRLAAAVAPEDRAYVELSIAEHRLDEAERLATSGREDAAIIATASYGSSLADAAADLASVEGTDPRTAALVEQLQMTLTMSQQRVATTATRLATDVRTVSPAKVLAAVSATAAPSNGSPATRIADQAVAITAELASVADARANSANLSAKRTARPTQTPRASGGSAAAVARPTGTARPTAASMARPASPSRSSLAATPQQATSSDEQDEDGAAPSVASAPPFDVAAARSAADRAKAAAAQARAAAEKAKRAAFRTLAPAYTRR
jgi:hypothetical protein